MKQSLEKLRAIVPYLPTGAKRYMIVYIAVSIVLVLVDVASLMLLAFSMTAILAGKPIMIPLVGAFGREHYLAVMLVISLLILAKSGASVAQQWFATRKFATFEMEIGRRLFTAYLEAPWLDRLKRSTSELVRMADVGIAAVNAGLILPILAVPSLVITAVLMAAALVVAQPFTALATLLYLGGITLLLYVVLSRRTVEAGRVNRTYSFKVAGLMTDMVGALKEITLQNKVREVASVVQANRAHATRARANIQFLGAIPKFVMDTALIGGFVVIGLVQFALTRNFDDVINAVVLFAVAGMRIIPSITGFQATMNILQSNDAQVAAVLKDIAVAETYVQRRETLGRDPIVGEPRELILDDVVFSYPNREKPAVNHVSARITIGSSVGLVGESGSGKSTLVDIILGLLEPQQGEVRLDDQHLTDILAAWRARVGYVPQEVSLFDGTIEQNVALTWQGEIDRERVIECLKKAQMWETVQERPGGLQGRVGERGIALSGGQRQRLGIARALYADPLVLILDEATSALDTETEAEVAQAIRNLRGKLTLISIAHRLSTVKDSDVLLFMEDGHVKAQGTFDEVVAAEPAFAHQAELSGLIHHSENSTNNDD
ncbi:MAG: ABC transporter ATP-binding protein/permease [Arcanobacterium sp.]|nr:ABC transporter ATP-binding protein/permease [Arcanobacterium sp.]